MKLKESPGFIYGEYVNRALDLEVLNESLQQDVGDLISQLEKTREATL